MKKTILSILLLCSFILLGQTQIGQTIYGENANDLLSQVSLSTDGTIMAVGTPDSNNLTGYVKVFQKNGNNWQQIGQKLEGGNTNEQFGSSLSLSADGTILAVGSITYSTDILSIGKVNVYQFSGGNWTAIGQDITGSSAYEFSGASIALSADGSILAIGAPSNSSTVPSYTITYQYNGYNWIQMGQILYEEGNNDFNGASVALSADGTILASGAIYNDGGGSNSGHVRIYSFNGLSWQQLGTDINGEYDYNYFGSSLSLSADGTIIAIGASGGGNGYVKTFQYNGNDWQQIGQKIEGDIVYGSFGGSVSLSDDGTFLSSGSYIGTVGGYEYVRAYHYNGSIWEQLGNDIISDTNLDRIGWCVSLSGNGSSLAVSAPRNDANGIDSGQVKVYNLSTVLGTDTFTLKSFILYPNPVENIINISLQNNSSFIKATIYNQSGQLVQTAQTLPVNVSNLASGTYFIEIITNDGKESERFVKK